jgi:hypothetical protein
MSAICLVQWFHARSPAPERLIERSFKDIPSVTSPDVNVVVANNSEDFVVGVRKWMENNDNTQYLLTVSHGILDDDDTAIGIGSTPGDQEEPIADNQWISWDDLYSLVREAPSIAPHLLTIGCNTADAPNALSSRLTRDELHTPYLVGVDTEIHDAIEMLKIGYRMAQHLLEQTTRLRFLDAEFAELTDTFPHSSIHYPVTLVPGRNPRFVNVNDFNNELGITFQQYLSFENRVISGRSVPWP